MSKQSSRTIQEPSLEKFLKYGIYLVAFIPLVIFSQFLSPFHFGKVIVFRSLVEILAVLYIVLLVRYGRYYLPPRTSLFWAMSLFTLAFGITALVSINFYQSFFGTLERMGGWFSFFHFWMFLFIASAILRDKNDWLVFIDLSLAVSIISSFYGFLQKTDLTWVIGSGGRAKIFGTIGNPALFAGYIIINVFWALMLYFRPGNSTNKRIFYAAAFLINAYAVLLTGVRGSVMGIVVGIVLFGLLYSANFASQKIKKYTLAFLILVLISAGVLYSLRNTDFVKTNQYLSRYADISPTSRTVQTRALAWQAGFKGWNDSFKTIVFGWGPEMFNVPFSKYFNPEFFNLGSETLFDRAHNQFLEVLFTMGLIGFMAYILIYVFAFKDLKRLNSNDENKVFKIGLISTLVAYMIHNSFIFDTSANYLMFIITLGLINSLALAHQNFSFEPPRLIKRTLPSNIIGMMLLIPVALSIYFFEIVPVRANYTTTRAIVASWASEHDLAYEKFKKAMSYNTFGKYEIRHRFGQYILERTAGQTELDAKKKEQLLVAIENIKKNVEESPRDYLPHLYISRSYLMLGKNDPKSHYNDLGLEASQKALEISPTFLKTYYEIAQAYLNKKDYKKAIEWFEKAVVLSPKVNLSSWYLGVTVAQSGELQKGADIIEKSGYSYKSSETDALRMLDLYVRLGNFTKIAEIYEALIKISPKNPQYHASLAFAYKQLGQIEKAIKNAQIAASLDPAFAREAQDFINSLR